MKKVLALTLIMVLMLVGCGKESTTLEVGDNINNENSGLVQIPNEESIENNENTSDITEPEVPEGPKEIKPLKSGIDINNVKDAVLYGDFEFVNFDFEKKTLEVTFYEKDIYDAVDITTMKVGDTIIVNDEVFPVESISEENGFIDINGGYTASEFGMTFMPNEGGTFRTILLDDYSTYSKLGKVTLTIGDDFQLHDYVRGDYGDDPINSDWDGLQKFIEELPDWDTGFGYHNTALHIVDNQVVQIVRHWVP